MESIRGFFQKSDQPQVFIYICISICLYWTGQFKERQEAVELRAEWGTGSGKDLGPEPKLRSAKALAQKIWTICEYLSMSQAPFEVRNSTDPLYNASPQPLLYSGCCIWSHWVPLGVHCSVISIYSIKINASVISSREWQNEGVTWGQKLPMASWCVWCQNLTTVRELVCVRSESSWSVMEDDISKQNAKIPSDRLTITAASLSHTESGMYLKQHQKLNVRAIWPQ